jgi:hypothetical protein
VGWVLFLTPPTVSEVARVSRSQLFGETVGDRCVTSRLEAVASGVVFVCVDELDEVTIACCVAASVTCIAVVMPVEESFPLSA